MSAHLCSSDHISTMVKIVTSLNALDVLPEALFDTLLNGNLNSLEYRYPGSTLKDWTTAEPTYNDTVPVPESAAWYKIASYYDYQACEHPGYKESEAFKLVTLLQEQAKFLNPALTADQLHDIGSWGIR